MPSADSIKISIKPTQEFFDKLDRLSSGILALTPLRRSVENCLRSVKNISRIDFVVRRKEVAKFRLMLERNGLAIIAEEEQS